MRSAKGLLQVLLPRLLKAKVVHVMRIQKMKRRSQREPKPSEVQQLEITETKKSETAKRSKKRNAQMHSAAAMAVQIDGEAMVLCPESLPEHLSQLILSTPRIRSFASTPLTNCVCEGRKQ